LVVVPAPANIVAEMVRLTKPSGTVAIEDVDVGSWACEPPHPAWGRLFEIFERIYSRDGKDLRIGRRLPGLLRTAGLKDVECNTHVRVNRPGDLHQRQLIMFVKQLWRQIIDLKLINEPELIATFQELECHLARSDTLVVSPLMFQAWGTCPS
jgi:hypothetical protein